MPTIITVDPADAAALNSPPPEPPGRPESHPVEGGSEPGRVAAPATGAQPTPPAVGSRVTGRAKLPRTGVDLDRLAAAGLAATAAGAAFVLWSAEVKAGAPARRRGQ